VSRSFDVLSNYLGGMQSIELWTYNDLVPVSCDLATPLAMKWPNRTARGFSPGNLGKPHRPESISNPHSQVQFGEGARPRAPGKHATSVDLFSLLG